MDTTTFAIWLGVGGLFALCAIGASYSRKHEGRTNSLFPIVGWGSVIGALIWSLLR